MSMRSSIDLQKLRELPIEGVAERLGLNVTRHRSLCPFHDDHRPSLTFNTRRNTYRCYACGAYGGTIDLAMKLLLSWRGREGSFLEACRWLANESLTPIPSSREREETIPSPKGGGWEGARFARFFEHPWLNEEARKFLFDERRIDPRVVRWCRLTSWRDKKGINWLQIPYYNQEGKLVGIQNRNLSFTPFRLRLSKAKNPSPKGDGSLTLQGEVGGAAPRFRFPRGSNCHTYNLPVLRMLRQGEDLYITEGPSDCWAMLSAGHKAIAVPSATLLKRQELRRELTEAKALEKDITLHTYPDNDDAGENLYQQLLTLANELGLCLIRHDLPQGCKDFSDYWIEQA